jgi:hypothetical protein
MSISPCYNLTVFERRAVRVDAFRSALASDALLTTLHPLLENVLQTVYHFEIHFFQDEHRIQFVWQGRHFEKETVTSPPQNSNSE